MLDKLHLEIVNMEAAVHQFKLEKEEKAYKSKISKAEADRVENKLDKLDTEKKKLQAQFDKVNKEYTENEAVRYQEVEDRIPMTLEEIRGLKM